MNEIQTYLLIGLAVLIWFRLDRISRQVSLLQALLPPTTGSVEPSERVKELALDPQSKIEAMKLYRAESGADVRIARQVVESNAGGQSHA